MEVDYLHLVGEGYMGSMQWQLGREMGTIPAFASFDVLQALFYYNLILAKKINCIVKNIFLRS